LPFYGFSCGGGREYEDREKDESEDEDGHERDMPELGHGGEGTELVPRLMEALAQKKVIGASENHTAVWTDSGELFTFGRGYNGQLGHGGTQEELVSRMVEALAGKQVVGASAGVNHTAVWTEEGELFTFGD
jgi:hypothetical protein